MSHDLVSLDDIIKKSKSKSKTSSGTMPSRGGLRKPGGQRNGVKPNGTAPNRPKPTGNKPIVDARLKIIQKKRKNIADARDKLAQIAKQSDARLKLQKLRATNLKKIDQNILRKPGRNGRVTLSTNRLAAPRMPRSLPPAFIPPSAAAISYRPPPIPEPHYVNQMIMNYSDDYLMNHHRHQAALRRTVSNDYAPSLPPPPPIFNIKTPSYNWDKPPQSSSLIRNQSVRSSSNRPRDYKVIPRTDMTKLNPLPSYKNDWTLGSKSRTIVPEMDSKYYSMRNRRDEGVKSRLDSPPLRKSDRTAPIVPKAGSVTGFRIVVSNLQANVTQEDIKELFEDVGELLISRLVRPGIAEVIYKTLKDATKAVDTYHNRQLDGHPMKCLLVTPRPKTSSTNTSSSRVLSQPRSNYSHSSLEALHRALFD